MENILKKFNQATKKQMTDKEHIIKRLLDEKQITTSEAILLMREINVKIEAEHLEMSSGAKIVGGSDFETTDFGN